MDGSGQSKAGQLVASGVFSGQLQVLVWQNRFDDVFTEFLKSQMELSALVLTEYITAPRYPIPQCVCARLTAFGGPPKLVEAILPLAPKIRTLLIFSTRSEPGGGLSSSMDQDGSVAVKCMRQITRLTFRNHLANLPILACPWDLKNVRLLALEMVIDNDVSLCHYSARIFVNQAHLALPTKRPTYNTLRL